ncbi:hypothetical protein [Pedobacter glucosidilyticus]|uniref:hypothetical protein n=1 Tax=Pedobacter glucosidilyticus TaxID=1122941 RepID=UPI0026EC59A7|nr:hypothetical protein [Pedobacter glucosidilyticus]
MSDKELDILFKSKFEDYEVEPSVSSWSKIEEQLSIKPMQRRKVPFLWMAAASVLVVLGLGLIFWNKPQEQIMLKGKPAVEEGNILIAQNNSTSLSNEVNTSTKQTNIQLGNQENEVQKIVKAAPEQNSLQEENLFASTQANKPEIQQEQELVIRTEPVKRITVTELILLEEENAAKTDKIKSSMFSSLNEDNQSSEKIRSVGDLVNFVIAKVDKREQKLIRISKTDESDIEITGINLGLFKYKKD